MRQTNSTLDTAISGVAPLVSVLIVSYNTREMTLECIRSVFEQANNTQFELIVLDNASSDGSATAISAEFGNRVRLICSERNLGFAEGNNKVAQEASGRWFLLLNPDTVVLHHAIDRIIEFAIENPDAGIWGGRTVFADGSPNPASCWSRQTLWSLAMQALTLSSIFRENSVFNPEGIGGWDRSTEREVEIVSGCFLLISCHLWRQLNGFHPDFFMYGEDADLCLRARALGSRPRVTPHARIVHHGGASEDLRVDKLCRLLAAKMLLVDRHFTPTARGVGKHLLSCWPFSRALLHFAISRFRPSSREASQVWFDVWSRRNTWKMGLFAQEAVAIQRPRQAN